jgi:hypothetical protein
LVGAHRDAPWAEGAIASRNALTHGITSTDPVIAGMERHSGWLRRACAGLPPGRSIIFNRLIRTVCESRGPPISRKQSFNQPPCRRCPAGALDGAVRHTSQRGGSGFCSEPDGPTTSGGCGCKGGCKFAFSGWLEISEDIAFTAISWRMIRPGEALTDSGTEARLSVQ